MAGTDSKIEDDAFQYVQSPSRRKRKGKHTKQDRPPEHLLQQCLRELGEGDWILECKQIVRDSLAEIQWSHSEPIHVLCLGLGSPTSSQDAAAQLAFLLNLCDDLNIPYSRVSAYDPVFSDQDATLLRGLQIRVLKENQMGKHVMDSATLVFMPHCGIQLYEAILAANWDEKRLYNMLLICNQFSQYETTIPRRTFISKYPHLLRYISHSKSILFPDCKTHRDAFVSVTVQFIPPGEISIGEREFWSTPPSEETVPQDTA